MKHLLVSIVITCIAFAGFSQSTIPFKVYGDIQVFNEYKWFKKPKPQDTGNRDTLLTVDGNKFRVRIINWDTVGQQEPDSLYIRYDSLCLVDSSGWVMIGDTITIDTCSTSPFKGCDTSSYDPVTNVLTICDSVYTLVWNELWVRKTIGPYNTLSPRTITDRVSIGTINGTAGMLNVTGSTNIIGQTINTDLADALDIWTNTPGDGIYVNNSNGGNTGEGLRLNTRAYNYAGNSQALYSRNWGGGISAEFWQQSMLNTTHGGNISPYNPTVRIIRGDYLSNSVNWYNSLLEMVNQVNTSGDNAGYYIKAYEDETVDEIKYTLDINGTSYQSGQVQATDTIKTDASVHAQGNVISGDVTSTTTTIYPGGIFIGVLDSFPDYTNNIKYLADSDSSWILSLSTGVATIGLWQDTGNLTSIEMTATTIENLSDVTKLNNITRLGLKDGVETADSSFTEFEKDGTMEMVGEATVWDIVSLPFRLGFTPGTTCPTFVADSGYYSFSVDTVACKLYYTVQVPPGKLLGSKIYPAVYYKYETTPGAPTFKLRYKWFDVNESVIQPWSWYTMDNNSGNDDKSLQYVSGEQGIYKPDVKVNSILICELYMSAQTGTGDIHAYNFIINIEKDMIGSRSINSK